MVATGPAGRGIEASPARKRHDDLYTIIEKVLFEQAGGCGGPSVDQWIARARYRHSFECVVGPHVRVSRNMRSRNWISCGMRSRSSGGWSLASLDAELLKTSFVCIAPHRPFPAALHARRTVASITLTPAFPPFSVTARQTATSLTPRRPPGPTPVVGTRRVWRRMRMGMGVGLSDVLPMGCDVFPIGSVALLARRKSELVRNRRAYSLRVSSSIAAATRK